VIVIAATVSCGALPYFIPPPFNREGSAMFGEERSYFRYVVVGLVGLMMVGFWMMSTPG
jgi:hypothetical protein